MPDIKLKRLSAELRASLSKITPPNGDRPVPGTLAFRAATENEDTAELLIYGNIGDSWWDESVTAKSVVEQLRDNTAARILVRINSYGGSVTDGIAIYNELRAQVRKGVTVDGQVDSIAASIASLIAMACGNLEMPETASMMLHAPWGGVWGNAKDLREYAEILDGYGAAMALAYAKKTGKPAAEFEAMWAEGKDNYFNAAEAVEYGLADSVVDAAELDAADEEDDVAEAAAVVDAALQRLMARAPREALGQLFAAARPPLATKPAPVAAKPAPTAPLNPPAPAVATTPADAGTTTGEPAMPDPVNVKDVLAADKKRRETIRSQFAPFEGRADLNTAALATLRQACEDNTDTTPEAAGQQLLALLGQNTTPVKNGPAAVAGQDETDHFRGGMVVALLHRANPSAHKLDDNGQRFMGMDLQDMAREAVERTGQSTRGMRKSDIAIKAMQSTSDFPNILENVVTRSLRAGYAASARTFVPFSRQTTLPDFKTISRAQLGGAPNLKRVLEGAEYEYGAIGEGAEKYAVQKYGRIVALTWETIINDDLDALTRIPLAFGASAADLESDLVYAILTGNAALSDGVALFHASHGNLGTAGALLDAIHPNPTTANPLAEMRKKMVLQKGIEGRYITVRPKFLIVPPSLEEAALKVTAAGILAARSSDVNVAGPSLTPIVEPRLEDSSAQSWYGAAEPLTVDTIEYAYLEGHEGVFTETKAGFEVDGVQIKCRHVFGAKAIDYRGLFKNVGAAPTAWPAP